MDRKNYDIVKKEDKTDKVSNIDEEVEQLINEYGFRLPKNI